MNTTHRALENHHTPNPARTTQLNLTLPTSTLRSRLIHIDMGFLSDTLGLRSVLGLFQKSSANHTPERWKSPLSVQAIRQVDITTLYPSPVLTALLNSGHAQPAKAILLRQTATGTSFLGGRALKPLRVTITRIQPAKAVLTTETANGTIHQVEDDEIDNASEDPHNSIFTGVTEDAQSETQSTSSKTFHTALSGQNHPDEDLFDDKQERSSSGSSSRSSSPEDPDPDAIDEDLRAD
jgi:hypothetical protein